MVAAFEEPAALGLPACTVPFLLARETCDGEAMVAEVFLYFFFSAMVYPITLIRAIEGIC